MLSRTLFKYIFKDLFRIFMMTSGALAGIMSFGGLLRPLTREGLDAGQVGKMLTYFTPAMTTYSFPIAALFATAVVYGRLSADNELTAARSSGISLFSMTVAGPALVLGLVVAIVSLLFLCFIVPASTLKVEKVVYSNLAKFVAGRIERNHEISFADQTIFAQDAIMPPPQTLPPGQQQVVLISPTIVTVDRPRKDDRSFRVPKDFYTASRAILYIDPLPNGEEVQLTLRLDGGFKFPRQYEGAVELGVQETEYGPFTIASPIKEDVKFMDVWRLKELYANVADSQKLRRLISLFVFNGQRQAFFKEISDQLNGPTHRAIFNFENNDRYVLSWEGQGPAMSAGAELIAPIPQFAPSHPAGTTRPVADPNDAGKRPVVFRHEQNGRVVGFWRAAELHLYAKPNAATSQVDVTVDLRDVAFETSQGMAVRERFPQPFTVPMSEEAKAIGGRDLSFYESPQAAGLGDQKTLVREKTSVINSIIAESNGRASFAISCLILVMVGCALGMMFKSGNFLTAFAVSFVPALLSITLIIAGQRTASRIPIHFTGSNNPLDFALALIWCGNLVNLCLAIGLMWKLQRR